MKRYMALVLSTVMALSSLPVTAYAANFTDMDDVPWSGAETVINSVADLGLLKGYEDGTFRAKNNVTYCEAMQMLYTTLLKTGMAEPLDAVTAYQHYNMMQLYNIPAWAQTAVAYGLEKGIIDNQTLAVKFMNGTSSNYATREDVAKMFGNAMKVRYEMDSKTTNAQKFGDYWRISVDAMQQVDLLKRLEILSGDNHGNFNPKNNINRAEMAVMLNKTYNVLQQGTGLTGTITDIEQNEGQYFYFSILMDDGMKEGFHANVGEVKAYAGTSDQEISLSRISRGDKISLLHNGTDLIAIRVLDAVPEAAKYDVAGHILSMDKEVKIENENTGDSDIYSFSDHCFYYLEGEKVTKKEMKDAIEEKPSEFAYAKVMLETETKKVKDEDGKSSNQELAYIYEIHVTFEDEYMTAGQVDEMTESAISFSTLAGGDLKYTLIDEDCEFYVGETEVDMDKILQMADSGTVYAQVTIGKHSRAVKIVLSEDSFDPKTNEAATNVTYEVRGLNDKRLILENGGEEVTYVFGSANPVKNIDFYGWDTEAEDWEELSFSGAEDYYYNGDDEDDKELPDEIYCRIEFDAGGRLSEVQLSEQKSAWKKSGEQTERKGTIASLKDGILKFETSTIEYKMLSKYNQRYVDKDGDRDDEIVTGMVEGEEVRNPLIVEGALKNSLTVFEKMASSEDVEVYAEIVADGDNNVVQLTARPVKAVGKLVEYIREHDERTDKEKQITIELSNGTQLTVETKKTPKLTDEDDDFKIEHIASTSYVGSLLELGFSENGVVDTITVLESTNNQFRYVKGIAEAAEDGLEVEDEDDTYEWLERSRIEIVNYSMQSRDLEKLKALIEDDDVEVYVKARLDEKDRVEKIYVTVKSAEGTLAEYDEDHNVVRILTDDGNKFSFDCIGKVTCDVNEVTDPTRLDMKCEGEEVELVFGEDGLVYEINDR